VDRRAAILPPDAPPEVARVSPLEASVRYLEHLRHAWDQSHPEASFAARAGQRNAPSGRVNPLFGQLLFFSDRAAAAIWRST
ncbi:MAG TPA: Hsp70 family protein, partial [Thermoanaerobaculia bacterium]|nr:Hsp70 family protein [Thermoanaerobaculia bacterium]